MSEPERHSSWTFVLIVVVLLLPVAVLVAFVPIAKCPGLKEEHLVAPSGKQSEEAHRLPKCPECDGSGRVTFLKRWRYRDTEPILYDGK
jgi:hypothetical protein